MKFKFILFFFLSISAKLFFSQTKENLADIEMQKIFENYKSFNFDSVKEKKGFSHVKWVDEQRTKKNYERLLDNGITEENYNFEINYVGEDNIVKFKNYDLTILKKSDSIIALINFDTYRKKTKFYVNHIEVDSLIANHNKFYDVKSNLKDFIDSFADKEVYGYNCGTIEVEKILSFKGAKFNKKSNRRKFRNWLKSYNPEVQTYGIDALNFLLKTRNIKLTILESKLIEHIMKRNSLLNTCSGCIFGNLEKKY